MISRKTLLFFFSIFLIIFLVSCSFPSGEQEVSPTATLLLPTTNPAPTATVIISSPTPEGLRITPPQSGTVVLDFVALVCSAQWSNNAYQLPCPGHLEDIGQGYIASLDHTIAEGMLSVEAPLLTFLPGRGNGNGVGIFGRYPALTIFPGDTFHAMIACQGDSPCDTEFALEYFDEYGAYHHSIWAWSHQAGDGIQEISADLSPLAGQSVELMLVAREQGELEENWLLWIQPYIARDPNAQPVPTALATSTPEASQIPGVISGAVDMSTSPPYLTDPMKAESTPVVVTFFNLDDGTYWYIQTLLTGHPNFQMTVPPGRYQVVAYARGVGDIPYVAAGYTGRSPSCGQALQVVEVAPNARVENIIIADWNWTCGGTAYRPEKPASVPVP